MGCSVAMSCREDTSPSWSRKVSGHNSPAVHLRPCGEMLCSSSSGGEIVTMMQTAEPGHGYDLAACAGVFFCRATGGRSLRQREMRSVVVVVADVIIHKAGGPGPSLLGTGGWKLQRLRHHPSVDCVGAGHGYSSGRLGHRQIRRRRECAGQHEHRQRDRLQCHRLHRLRHHGLYRAVVHGHGLQHGRRAGGRCERSAD